MKIEYNILSEVADTAKRLKHTGMKNIIKPIEIIDNKKDMWLITELGDCSLGKSLFHIKGAFVKGERIYEIIASNLYKSMIITDIKILLRSMFNALDLLQASGIVHADIKPENILINTKDDHIVNAKLIDFGSAFYSNRPSTIRMSTPEYLGPEVLEYFNSTNFITERNNSSLLCSKISPWSYDMWSLGCVLLETLVGFPLWLSLKSLVQSNKGSLFTKGLFSCSGRDEKKIASQQRTVVRNLRVVLSTFSRISNDDCLDLLTKMLELNPRSRISPKEALKHPFLKEP